MQLDNGGSIVGVDNNYVKLKIGTSEYYVFPANYFGYGSDEFFILSATESYIISNKHDDYLESKALDEDLPEAIEKFEQLNFQSFKDGQLTISGLQQLFGGSVTKQGANFTIELPSTTALFESSDFKIYNPCQGVSMVTLVNRYKQVLGLNNPHINFEQIIEAAITTCTPINFDPRSSCLDTRCVVNNILADPEIAGSTHSPYIIKLNYLKALLKINAEDYDWLYDKILELDDLIVSMIDETYSSLNITSNNTACGLIDCSRKGAINAYIKSYIQGQPINNYAELIEFTELLYCNNVQLYETLYDRIGEVFNIVGSSCTGLISSDEFEDCIYRTLALEKHNQLLATYPEYASSNINVNAFINQYGAQKYYLTTIFYEAFMEEIQTPPNDPYEWQLMMEVFRVEIFPILLTFTPYIGDFIDAYNDFNDGNYFMASFSLLSAALPYNEVIKAIEKSDDIKKAYKIWKSAKAVYFNIWNAGGQKIFNNIPTDWRNTTTKKFFSPTSTSKGFQWFNPNNNHHHIRAMQGDINSSFPNSQNPYVRLFKDDWRDKFGNIVNPSDYPLGEADPAFNALTHIPISQITEQQIINFLNL